MGAPLEAPGVHDSFKVCSLQSTSLIWRLRGGEGEPNEKEKDKKILIFSAYTDSFEIASGSGSRP